MMAPTIYIPSDFPLRVEVQYTWGGHGVSGFIAKLIDTEDFSALNLEVTFPLETKYRMTDPSIHAIYRDIEYLRGKVKNLTLIE